MQRRTFLAGMGLSLTCALAACGEEKTVGAAAGATAAAANATLKATDSFPVTLEHTYGRTVIESEPRRVATVSAVGADVVLALGVVPAGMPKVSWGGDEHGAYPWTTAALESLGASWERGAPTLYSEAEGLNAQILSSLSPDVILGVFSGMTQHEYDELSAIAPTVAFPKKSVAFGTSWEDSITMIGQALGRSVAAEALVRTTSTEVTTAASKYPGLAGATYAIVRVDLADPDSVTLYSQADNRCRVFNLLGMKPSQSVLDAGGGTTDSFYVSVPAAKAASLDADVVWVWIDDGAAAAEDGKGAFESAAGRGAAASPSASAVTRDAALEAARAMPLWSRVPALSSDHAMPVTDAATVMALAAASPLSLPWFCEHHLPEIGRLVDSLDIRR